MGVLSSKTMGTLSSKRDTGSLINVTEVKTGPKVSRKVNDIHVIMI